LLGGVLMPNLTKSDKKLLSDTANKLELEAIYRSKEISINIGIHTEISIPPVVNLLKRLANDENTITTFWIIRYYHKHGDDCWPMFQETEPTEEEMTSDLANYEPEREDEGLEVYGPFTTR
jgi:hypothetical protein